MIGIVAEFNPYHSGHKYLIDQARLRYGDEPIVVCMSGDFVQRGEPAIKNKFIRASNTDADLIIELPLPWCLSSAEAFARGSVGLLRRFGCDRLVFGSECGDVEKLKINVDYDEVVAYQKQHPEVSWPSARSAVIGSDILDYPNNILGFEYLKYSGDMDVFSVKRTNVHDGIGSAMEIRKFMKGPDLEKAAVSRLKMFSKEYYNQLPDSDNGIGNRLYDAVGNYNTLDEIFKGSKTKRITESAIRRLVYCAVLGVTKDMNKNEPEYARILYMNDKGRMLLRNRHDVAVITNPGQINKLDEISQKVFAVGASAHDFYLLGNTENEAVKRGEDYRTKPIIVKSAQ